ncbi:MAG: hypothetical protein K5756_08990 [Clostridiales bacterium]|nr:hypothetical protein [Clostridiales bacterium]
MVSYDNDILRDSEAEEKKVSEIRAAALKKAQMIDPDIKFVIDRFTIDDYCYKKWDYPGAWYSMGFKLPEGFRSEEELINAMTDETIRYFDKKRVNGRKHFFRRKRKDE